MKLAQLVCTSLLGCITTSALAGPLDKPHSYYASAEAGIFQANFNNKYLDQTDVIPLNIAQTASQTGYTTGVAFGYRKLVGQRYLTGWELSANMDGNNASFQSGASSTTFSDQIKINYHYDLTFVPGLMLSNDIAAYLKLGISYAFVEDRLGSPAGFGPATTSYNSHKNVIGFAAGLGVVKSLSEHVSLFTEADYHDYGTLGFSNFQNYMATYTHTSHVYSYDVVLGIAYTI